MRVQSKSKTSWLSIYPDHAQIDMLIDLTISDFLQSADISAELSEESESIRQELFKILALKILPDLVQDTKVNLARPPEVSYTAEISNSNEWSQNIEANGVVSSNRLSIRILLTTDVSVHPIVALDIAKGDVAEAIANSVVGSLQMKFLGKNLLEKTESEIEIIEPTPKSPIDPNTLN